MKPKNKKLIFAGLNQNVLKKLERAKFDYVTTFSNINDAIEYAMHKKNFIHKSRKLWILERGFQLYFIVTPH